MLDEEARLSLFKVFLNQTPSSKSFWTLVCELVRVMLEQGGVAHVPTSWEHEIVQNAVV